MLRWSVFELYTVSARHRLGDQHVSAVRCKQRDPGLKHVSLLRLSNIDTTDSVEPGGK